MDENMFDDIKLVLDISSRVDERVKMIQSSQQDTHERLNQISKDLSSLMTRVTIIESKNGGKIHQFEDLIHSLDKRVGKVEPASQEINKIELRLSVMEAKIHRLEEKDIGWVDKTKYYTGLIVQGVWVIVVCYLLYRLGLNTPPIP